MQKSSPLRITAYAAPHRYVHRLLVIDIAKYPLIHGLSNAVHRGYFLFIQLDVPYGLYYFCADRCATSMGLSNEAG